MKKITQYYIVLTGKNIGPNTHKRWYSEYYYSSTYRHNAKSFDTKEEAEACLRELNKKVAWIEEVTN